MERRDLLKSAAASAGLTILKSGTLRGQNAPSNKLNVALIGVWGRGTAHYNVIENENVVAFCDVNDSAPRKLSSSSRRRRPIPDWRRVLDQKDVEAVIICTADHHHAFIANWALNRDMHVFCEKPLGISVEETRVVRANYLKRRNKVATQHGTQRHAYPNFERIRELILDGAIGELKTVHSWDSRKLAPSRLPGGRRAAALVPALRAVDRTLAVSPVQPAVLRRIESAELPVLEHVPRLRSWPDGRHGRAHHGSGVERGRRRRAARDRGRSGSQRQVRPGYLPGEVEGDL
jgi:hypothetical protein